MWALLKRQIFGIHHWVSDKHLNRYVSEMTWRFNRRDMKTTGRMNDLFTCVEGRLAYKMTNKGRKMEPPLKLDMSFDEALSRFVATKPEQVDESIKRSKAKRLPQDAPPRRPARFKREAPLSSRKRKQNND